MTSSRRLLLATVSFLCSQIVVARYCSRETDHSSATGDFVSFSIDERESRIRVRANGLNWFGWIGGYVAVRGFKGDGYGHSSRWPTIFSSTVYKSLFSKEALSAVFNGMDKEKMELALSAQRDPVRNEDDPFFKIKKLVRHYFGKLHTMKLVVKDADRPISIGNLDHVYFWGPKRLPDRAGECAKYSPSNDHRNVSFCKHEEMEQCAAKISAFPQLTPFSLETSQGEPITHFTWLCKAGSVCCAWECCEPYPRDTGDTVMGVFLLIWGPGSMLVLYVLKRRERRRVAAEEKEKGKTEEAAPLQSPDQLPTITTVNKKYIGRDIPDELPIISSADTEGSTLLGTTNEKLDHGAIVDIRAFVMND